MTKRPTNIAASIRARLLAGAKERQEDFNLTLKRYAAERFLYRLGKSEHREQLVLKGAMLFALWGSSLYRPTRDLDFTGYGSSAASALLKRIAEICSLEVEEDGLVFDLANISAESIRDGAQYDGLRVRFSAALDQARIEIQIDVGFDNAIEPGANDVRYPTLLADSSAPEIRAYPQEAVIAEKFNAMVVIGERNTRFKDFYDLYTLATQFAFESDLVAGAIAATFKRRGTPLGGEIPVALTARFYAEIARGDQWRAYLDRDNLPGAPRDFTPVGELFISFLLPVWSHVAGKEPLRAAWPASGPWDLAR